MHPKNRQLKNAIPIQITPANASKLHKKETLRKSSSIRSTLLLICWRNSRSHPRCSRAVHPHNWIPTETGTRSPFPTCRRGNPEKGLNSNHTSQGNRTCKVVRRSWDGGERMLFGGRGRGRGVWVPLLDHLNWLGGYVLGLLAIQDGKGRGGLK